MICIIVGYVRLCGWLCVCKCMCATVCASVCAAALYDLRAKRPSCYCGCCPGAISHYLDAVVMLPRFGVLVRGPGVGAALCAADTNQLCAVRQHRTADVDAVCGPRWQQQRGLRRIKVGQRMVSVLLGPKKCLALLPHLSPDCLLCRVVSILGAVSLCVVVRVWSADGTATVAVPCSAVAREPELRGRISFVWADGVEHGERMWSLGLNPAVLPSLAFNVKDGRRLVLPSDAAVTAPVVLEFCRDFLSGRLAPQPAGGVALWQRQ